MVKRAQDWKSKALENLSYKIVAFFVTLILWITILGRRDIVLTKEVDLEFLLPPAMSLIENNIDRKIEVKVSGPRIALKKFAQNPGTITVDLSRSQGRFLGA
jgi:YbbR domain-containing protein